MKYYIDTEFLEGVQDKIIFGIKYGETKPTIDLISIGIVSEDNREYYAISKDFNLKEAWSRYDLKVNKQYPQDYDYHKVYWIRDNVLKPIFKDWIDIAYKDFINGGVMYADNNSLTEMSMDFNYKNFKLLLNRYGKSNKQIAEEVQEFVANPLDVFKQDALGTLLNNRLDDTKDIQFYGYFVDYDWVVFCWLFGKMIDLPKGFPMYCIDLKQMLDNYISKTWKDVETSTWGHEGITLDKLKQYPNYPKQINEHNALADAKWNKELYRFIDSLSSYPNGKKELTDEL